MGAVKVKPKLKNGIVKVKALASHEMTTFDMMQKRTGNRDDANYIEHITASVNGTVVWEASTSQFLAKNPIFKFQFKGIGKKGDKVEMVWVDRKGKTGKGHGKIK